MVVTVSLSINLSAERPFLIILNPQPYATLLVMIYFASNATLIR